MRSLLVLGTLLLGAACGSSGTPMQPAGDAGEGADAHIRPPGPAMGANVTDHGVTFRVWAPHAHAAYVAGDFTDVPIAMDAAADGVFQLEVSGAHAGNTYHYELDTDGDRLRRADPYCRELTGQAPECIVVDPGAYAWHDDGFAAPDRAHSIVYELHVGSFTSAGTFAAATERLAELHDLGVTVVEVMPVDAFGGGDRSWGYNPQLYLAPKHSYGSADDLRRFVDEAHRQGIAVWVDFVANHSDGYRAGPLVCYDGYCPNNAWGIYFFPPGTYATTPWGPRPNYSDPHAATMLLDAVAQWIGELHGDGFRWDSVSNIRALDGNGTTPGGKELLVAANDLTHHYGGLAVAEDLKGYGAITQPTSAGGFGFDAQWDGFGYTMTSVLVPFSDDGRDMGAIEYAVRGGFDRLLWTENHDSVGNGGARFPVRVDGANPESFAARRRSMLAAALMLTAPGVPMLFMGQDALATSGFGDPPRTLPSPTPVGTKVRAFYKDLIALRRNAAGGTAGLAEPKVDILHRNDANKVIAYRRSGPSNEEVIVIVNLRNRAYTRYDIGVPASGSWRVRLDSDWKAYGDDFGGGTTAAIATLAKTTDGRPYTLPVPLAAYGVLVLSH